MKNSFFPEVNGCFGFGCMRFPMKDGKVDQKQVNEMIDIFLAAGLNYFDTAHGYLQEQSEIAVREGLTKRYPRNRYILTNKLSGEYFEKEEDILPLFEKQLVCCGVEYFDFYLMHAQSRGNYEKYQNANAYAVALKLKKEGKIHHMGISFHDSAEFLDKILSDHPEVELVQIQLNYLDYDEPMVESRKCCEVCQKHGKAVIVMEPVKGGSLINLPQSAQNVLDALPGDCSNAGYALRFAADNPQVFMVLSGMSDMAQMQDNLKNMTEPKALTGAERQALQKVAEILRKEGQIPCTSCSYCVKGCPQEILIPGVFAAFNVKKRRQDFPAFMQYKEVTSKHGKVENCAKCGKCEDICPQHLNIRELLEQAAEAFSKPLF